MLTYNRTNFVSQSFAQKLLEAMRNALATGLPQYVENRNNQRWLRVAIKEVPEARTGFHYEFYANNSQEVGHLILQGSFVWDRALEREFANLLHTVYELQQHPLTRARRAATKAYLMTQGVTHALKCAVEGITYFGYFKRSMLGLRKTWYVVADSTGRQFREAFPLPTENLRHITVRTFP